MSNSWLIHGGNLVTPEEVIEDGALVVHEGRIVYVGKAADLSGASTLPGFDGPLSLQDLPEIDAQGMIIAPGYVDVHVHGGGKADTMNATLDALATMSTAHLQHGTAVMLPTTMTAPHGAIVEAARCVREAMEVSAKPDWPGARIVGMHMEGPYIHPDRVGAQHPEHVRRANLEELEELYAILGHGFRLITLAPELPENLEVVSWLRERGIAISIGHTSATYEEAVIGFERGINHATHTYNAMTPLQHRSPGVVGAVLTDERVYAELIADGIHIHPAAMAVLVKMKGPKKLCLITDAMEAMGMPDGRYELGGQPVILEDGACRIESGSLAGSVLAMDAAVANMVHTVGVDLVSAVRMASLTPAESVGIAQSRGSLTVGKMADVLLLDPESLRCRLTMVEGQIRYKAA